MPYALGLGALLGALTQLTPLAFLGLLGGLWLPTAARWLGLATYIAVWLNLSFQTNPWAAQYGDWVELEGKLREGFLQTPQGTLYIQHFPRLEDGHYRLEGRLMPPQNRRNPGGFDQAKWLQGLAVEAVLQTPAVLEFQPFGPSVRSRAKAQLEAGLSPTVAALTVAMTLGERRDFGELYGEFQRAGLAHALALSGLNVAILAGFLVLVFYRLGHWRYLLSLLLLWSYLWLVGPQPSLLRAVVMASFVLLGLFVGKGKVQVLPALSLALFIHLLLEPKALFSLSFQLSYLAVLGMAVVLPRLPKVKGWKGWVLASLGVTFAAQLFILPLLLHTFNFLPLASPISNLVILPLLELLVPLGFVKLLLGSLLAWPVEVISQVTLTLVGWLSKGPQLYWGEMSWVGFGLYFLGLAPLLLALYQRLSWRFAAVLTSTAILASLVPSWVQRPEIWQLDVGQGDASLVRLPGNVNILVDGGREWAYPRLEASLRALGILDLDMVIATHADADHIESLPRLMQHFKVGALVTGPVLRGDALDVELRLAAARHKVRVLRAEAGTHITVSRAKLRFLGPHGDETVDNDRSLVFVLEYAGRKALFTGDAPSTLEARWKPEPVDVLKVGHHGSSSSTSPTLLARFRPKIALIGVGNNTYGHPTKAVLDRLIAHGVQIRRTDVEGAVRIPFW